MPQRILAIGAHPDDLEFWCGALLITETRRGHAVVCLVLSRGEAASHGSPPVREAEARAAAAVMGAEVVLADLGGDCHLVPAAAVALAREIRRFHPQVVVAPLPVENQHPDHVVVGRLARDASRLARYAGLAELKDLPAHAISALYFYPATPNVPARPDIVVDVTPVVGQWEQAMRCHASQLQTKRYVELQLTRARLLGLEVGTEYAQGVYTDDPLHLAALTDVTRSSRNF